MVSRKAKLRIEAPVNGGRNYEVNRCSYVNKSGYMLERLSIRRYFARSNNPFGADNQQERLARARILRDYTPDSSRGDDIVRTAWRHAELDGNVQAHRKMSNIENGPKVDSMQP